MSNRFGIDAAGIRRAVVGAVICCCAAGCLFGGRPKPIITSNDPSLKIPAIKRASDARDTQTARQLIKSLESDDPAVRFYAIRGLQNLTGETFGYVWYVEEPARREAMEKWKHWLDANHAGSLAGGERN